MRPHPGGAVTTMSNGLGGAFTGHCRLGLKLHDLETEAREGVKRTAVRDLRREGDLGQVALELQRTRLGHLERCHECRENADA